MKIQVTLRIDDDEMTMDGTPMVDLSHPTGLTADGFEEVSGMLMELGEIVGDIRKVD